jgi:hypothetical protein
MTQTVRETTTLTADPDTVWAVVGDVGAISCWVPAIESSSLDGNIRTAVFAGGGGVARERIAARDDATRSYTYEYLEGPLPLERYVSTIVVAAAPRGSEVVWDAEFTASSTAEEAGLRDAIAAIYADALGELAAQLDP